MRKKYNRIFFMILMLILWFIRFILLIIFINFFLNERIRTLKWLKCQDMPYKTGSMHLLQCRQCHGMDDLLNRLAGLAVIPVVRSKRLKPLEKFEPRNPFGRLKNCRLSGQLASIQWILLKPLNSPGFSYFPELAVAIQAHHCFS